jgi:general secretion pathway protein L
MARILGLDLGTHSLKAAVLETTMRGYTVQPLVSVPVPTEGERIDRIKAALPALLQQLPPVDTTVISLPGLSLALHPIALPFNDPKKIESTLAFEVEGQLPYDLDEAVFDHQLASADDKGTQLLVGVVRKDELGSILGALKEAKVDPRIVTHSGLVYQSLFSNMPVETTRDDAAVAIIDLGHERVSVAIGRPGGNVEFARSFAGGGAALTRALAQEFKIPLPEAASWKETHGAVGSEVVGPDAERAASAFVRALQPVLRELRPSLKSYTARTRRPIGLVLLCGGTAKLRGITEQFQQDVGITTRLLELPSETREVYGVGHSEAAQAVALALRGQASGAKAPRFNLRRGEFSFKSDFDFMRDKLGQIAAFAAVLFVLLIAGGIVRNAVLERREKQIDALFCDVTQRVLGKCEKDPTIAVAMLKGQDGNTGAGIPTRSAASILAELTSRVPADMKVTMDQLIVDLDRVSVRCEASDSKEMEDLISELKKYKCFKQITEGKLDKSKDGTKVTFRLEIQVECPDEVASAQ